MSTAAVPISSQRPASNNAVMNAILDAALGLTSLGEPSPTRSGDQQLNVPGTPRPITEDVTEASVVTHDVHEAVMDIPIFKAFLKPVFKKQMVALSMSRGLPPAVRSHSLHPSDAAMAMDRFSVSERVAMMDRAAALAKADLAPRSEYPYRYPSPPCPNQGSTSSGFQSILSQCDSNDDSKIAKTFPEILLSIMSNEENAHIVSWLPHGKGFIVHDKQRFEDTILPRYFDGAKFTSFTRRLKRWSFIRARRGPELGAYYNENFQRDKPELIDRMMYKKEGRKFAKVGKEILYRKKDEGNIQNSLKTESPSCSQGYTDLTNHQRILQNHILATKSPGINQYFTDPQERQMPLPSTLPKRHKKTQADIHLPRVRTTALDQRLASASTNDLKHALMYARIKSYNSPSSVSPEDANERRMIEIQRELLQSRARLSHSAGFGPSETSNVLSGSSTARYTTASTSKVTLRMEALKNHDIDHGVHAFPFPFSLAPPLFHRDNESGKSSPSSLEDELRYSSTLARSRVVSRMKEKGSPGPQVAATEFSNSSSGGKARPVMMTPQEEEYFTRYLLLQKRKTFSFV